MDVQQGKSILIIQQPHESFSLQSSYIHSFAFCLSSASFFDRVPPMWRWMMLLSDSLFLRRCPRRFPSSVVSSSMGDRILVVADDAVVITLDGKERGALLSLLDLRRRLMPREIDFINPGLSTSVCSSRDIAPWAVDPSVAKFPSGTGRKRTIP